MAKDFSKMASEIMKYIGGPDNVIDVAHCATRLRFRLKNTDMVDSVQLERTEGVIKTLESGGQFQIVIGNKVSSLVIRLRCLERLVVIRFNQVS